MLSILSLICFLPLFDLDLELYIFIFFDLHTVLILSLLLLLPVVGNMVWCCSRCGGGGVVVALGDRAVAVLP